VVRSGIELLGYTRRHLAIGKQGLCVACGNKVEFLVVVQLADRVQRTSVGRGSECQRMFELGALRVDRATPREEPMRVLPRDAELSGEIRDGKPLSAEQRLPDTRFVAHGRRW
jgi:hypothetical protein